MASLTFVPRPPLPPPVHNIPEEHSSQLDLDSPITPMCPASPSNMQMPQDDTASPTSPISPLNSSPIDLSFLKSNHSAIRAVPPRPAHQRSAAAIATAPLSRPLGFGMHTYVGEDGDTPYNTPVPRPAGRLAVGPVGGGGAGIANAGAGGSPIGSPRAFALNSSLGGFGGVGGATPANTPANRPPPAGRLSMTSAAIGGGGAPGRVSGGLDHIHIPSSLSTPLGGLQPLNAATAMRNRSSGVGIGIGGVSANANGNGIGNGNGHAQGGGGFTPGNTPSSLERVSRRLANNLMVGPRDGVTNQIAPSYERRFNAGLLDINHKLSAQPEHPEGSQVDSPSQSVQQTYGGSLVNSHWPTKFDSDTVMSEGKGEGADK